MWGSNRWRIIPGDFKDPRVRSRPEIVLYRTVLCRASLEALASDKPWFVCASVARPGSLLRQFIGLDQLYGISTGPRKYSGEDSNVHVYSCLPWGQRGFISF